MDWFEPLNRFHLHHYFLFNEQVDTVSAVEGPAAILALAQLAMHRDRGADDLLRQGIKSIFHTASGLQPAGRYEKPNRIVQVTVEECE